MAVFIWWGFPPASRGVPQIEVTFDIDADGIVSVSAKDLGTGKEQSIKITASSGLTEEEIQRLVRDAERHAEEDRKKRELVDARNEADSLIYSTEKAIKQMGEKLDEPTKSEINRAIGGLRKAMEGEDAGEIKRLTGELTQASYKLAETVYAKASQQQARTRATGAQSGGGASAHEDVMDADFDEVQNY